MGAGGAATGLTSEVLYLALPEISKVTMPPGPGVSLETALQLRPDDDWVLERQIHGILRSHDQATQRLMVDAQSQPKPLVPEDVKQKLMHNLLPTDGLLSAITNILSPRPRLDSADRLHEQGRQSP